MLRFGLKSVSLKNSQHYGHCLCFTARIFFTWAGHLGEGKRKMILGGRKAEGPIFEWLLQMSAFSTKAGKKKVFLKKFLF